MLTDAQKFLLFWFLLSVATGIVYNASLILTGRHQCKPIHKWINFICILFDSVNVRNDSVTIDTELAINLFKQRILRTIQAA